MTSNKPRSTLVHSNLRSAVLVGLTMPMGPMSWRAAEASQSCFADMATLAACGYRHGTRRRLSGASPDESGLATMTETTVPQLAASLPRPR